jgi:GR25 family glycosyltransferase involved in LPS biosynthesis
MANYKRSQAQSCRHGRCKFVNTCMKTFIIRLEENEHSCCMAQECYDQAVIHGLQPEFFKAINGNDSAWHYEITGIKKAHKFKKNRLGVLGCFFSHYYLWLKCIEENTPFVILEHDGFILKPFDSSILDTFEDVLKLDRLDPFSKSYEELIDQELNLPFSVTKYINLENKNPIKINTGNYFKGAYAYIIKPVAASKLIKYIKQYGHVPADQQIGDWIVDTKTTVPSLARLHPYYAIGTNIKQSSLTRNLKGNN